MKIIDLVILGFDSPVVRAYLSFMKYYSISPCKIIDLQFVKPRNTGLRGWIKSVIGPRLTEAIQDWKRYRGYLAKQERQKKLCDLLLSEIPWVPDYFSPLRYDQYAPEVEQIKIKNINDFKLSKRLTDEKTRTILFTGGGILTSSILDLPNKRFIHIHPGVVPYVKGSDGLFWSILVRGRPGMSSFYMNTGIDTGEIIATQEFEMPKITLAKKIFGYDVLYRGLLDFYDPILRATHLMNVIQGALKQSIPLDQLPCQVQNPKDGRTYFFMHEQLRNYTIDRIIHRDR